MYFLCIENKAADQLRGYCEADLRLCFHICKKLVFSRRGSYIPDIEQFENEEEVYQSTEKIEELIERLGFLPMTVGIFQKMRETFGNEECEFCGRLFFSKVDYEPHVRTHTGRYLLLK